MDKNDLFFKATWGHNYKFNLTRLSFMQKFGPKRFHQIDSRSDKKRTVLNKFLSCLGWNALILVCVFQNVYCLRFALGPLPAPLCLVVFVVRDRFYEYPFRLKTIWTYFRALPIQKQRNVLII
jgi:hypothetical protein